MMAENARLSQLEVQGEENGSEEKSSGDDLWGDLLVPEDDRLTPKKKIVLVMGAAGSGVLTNASQVLNRLILNGTVDSEASALKSVSSALVLMDLTQDFPEKVARGGIEAVLDTRDSDTVVVCVITSAARHVSVTSVLSKMEACGCQISYSIAVIAAQSSENFLRSHARWVVTRTTTLNSN